MSGSIKNAVKLTGKVVNIYSTDKVTMMSVATWDRTKREHPCFPKVIMFEKAKDEAIGIEVDDWVSLQCTMQTYEDINNPGRQKQRIVAHHVKKIDPETATPQHEFDFFGTVVRVIMNPNHVVLVTLRINLLGKPYYLRLVYYAKDANDAEKILKLAHQSRVNIKGDIETRRVEKDGECKYYENCVIKSATLIPPRPADAQ